MTKADQSLNSQIYIVDDDAGVRHSLTALLAAHDFGVAAFGSGAEFFTALPENATGCLIADINMPGISGLDILDEVIARKIKLAVVVVTGFGDVAAAVRAMKAGAVDFIEKPFAEAVILETVQKALSLAAGNAHQDAQADVIQGRLDQLTKREREIFDFLVAGMHSKTIASKFDLSPRTVEVHRAHIIEKMKAKTLSNLIRMGLILSFGNAAAKRL